MSPDGPPLPTWMNRLAHDLRSPLAPLMTAVYLLKSEQLPVDRRAELLELMERQGRRLGRMFDELDDNIRAGQGRLLGRRESCEAGMLLDLAFSEMRNTPAIEVTTTESVAQTVVNGDVMRLQQMLRILAEHALAQVDANALQVRLERLDAHLRIDIPLPGTSNGGDPPDVVLREPQPNPDDSGLGLKLLLARAIAHAHGGRLSVEPPDPDHPGGWLRCELPLINGHTSA